MLRSKPLVRRVPDRIYSNAGGIPRMADIYMPPRDAAMVPVVLWLHGGGWRFGDRHMAPDLASISQRSGLAVVSIDYRLSDEAKFPAPVMDVKTAVRWVRRVADEFGFDHQNIGLWGSSAGAHLAACAALSPEDMFANGEHREYSSTVQAVVDGYGPVDFSRIDADRAQLPISSTDQESMVIRDLLPAGDPDSFESRFLGTAVRDSPDQVAAANPTRFVRPENPPFLILHGEADTAMPWQQSWFLFEALKNVQNDATLVLFEKLSHGFFNHPHLEDVDYGKVTVHRNQPDHSPRPAWSCNPSDRILAMVESFLQTHLLRH
jgi:acetyl esterase/lipase